MEVGAEGPRQAVVVKRLTEALRVVRDGDDVNSKDGIAHGEEEADTDALLSMTSRLLSHSRSNNQTPLRTSPPPLPEASPASCLGGRGCAAGSEGCELGNVVVLEVVFDELLGVGEGGEVGGDRGVGLFSAASSRVRRGERNEKGRIGQGRAEDSDLGISHAE